MPISRFISTRLRVIVSVVFVALTFHCSLVTVSYGSRKHVVAAVLTSSAPPFYRSLEGFKETLNIENIDYKLTEFVVDNNSDNTRLISKIKSLKPDMIYSIGTKSSLIVKNEFSEIPVVFSMALNPVASGLVESMTSSSNNLTGASMDVPFKTQFEQLKKIIPSLKRVGVIFSRSQTGSVVFLAEKVAESMGLQFVKEEVSGQEDVPAALRRLAGKVDVLWSVADGIVFTNLTIKEILLFSLRKKLPFVGLSPAFVQAGALAAFELDHMDIGSQAGELAIEVLAGKKPSDLPITVPRKIRLFMNSNTIKLLKIKIPNDMLNSVEMIYP